MKYLFSCITVSLSLALAAQNTTQPVNPFENSNPTTPTQQIDTVWNQVQTPNYQSDAYNSESYPTQGDFQQQNYNSSTFTQIGNINIISNTSIDALVQKHIRMNINKTTEEGFRIQLIQNSSRNNVMETKATFLKYFPQTATYLSYSPPYFKLRIGDYTDKLEAYRNYKNILRRIPNAFIVPDVVNVSY